MALERAVVQDIIDYINSLPNGVAEKIQGNSATSGRADINACYKGRSIKIEVKTPDNKNTASALQQFKLQRWRKAGAIVMIAYSKAAVVDLFMALDTGWTGRRIHLEANGCQSYAEIPII